MEITFEIIDMVLIHSPFSNTIHHSLNSLIPSAATPDRRRTKLCSPFTIKPGLRYCGLPQVFEFVKNGWFWGVERNDEFAICLQ
jgi:hypothetical protein